MHFENIGYKIKSVERENVGWDLEAVNLQHKLFLEVKGLSGKTMTIELSSNEYSKSKITENYKICIVTNSLISPILNIFTYDKEKQKWANEKGQSLLLRENISAILSVEK